MSKRTIAEFEPLSAGEKTLLEGVSSGKDVEIGGTTVPDADAGEDRQVRGEFLRYLLLGGCKGLNERGIHVHEKGVRVRGALITDELDLQGCRIPRDIGLFRCRFEQAPVLRSAQIDNLFLNGSALPGLSADGLEAKGGVFLRGVVVTGAVRLMGARLGGDLSCSGAQLTAGGDGVALWADGLEAKGGVFLRGVVATGRVRLLGARLGVDLSCNGAQLTAGKDGFALLLNGAWIEGALFLRDKAKINGVLDLTGATIGMIVDKEECWPNAGNLILDRCQYGAFVGGPVTADARIKWLGLQNPTRVGADFWPQPWEQCAKVLREMGHGDDARTVLIDKEKRQRKDRLKQLWKRSHLGKLLLPAFWLWDRLIGLTVRYGHRPLLAFLWLLGFWLAGVAVFGYAERNHAIKPNDVRIIRSDEWVACAPDYKKEHEYLPEARNKTGISQLNCFRAQPEAKSYPRFNAKVYSADTLLPIVAMEMQSYWIPDDSNRGVGKWARRYLWWQIIAGWGLSLLAVAGFSGLIKSD